MSLDSICSRCIDVVHYCTCSLSDPAVINSKDYLEAESFRICRDDKEVLWDAQTRSLSGDPRLAGELMSHLDGTLTKVLEPGFCIWMSIREPYAVHYVAEWVIAGCTFPDGHPDWSPYSDPDTIY